MKARSLAGEQKAPRLVPLSSRLTGLIGLLALAWLALRNAVLALFAESQLSLALPFWPASGTALVCATFRTPCRRLSRPRLPPTPWPAIRYRNGRSSLPPRPL